MPYTWEGNEQIMPVLKAENLDWGFSFLVIVQKQVIGNSKYPLHYIYQTPAKKKEKETKLTLMNLTLWWK